MLYLNMTIPVVLHVLNHHVYLTITAIHAAVC